MSAIKFDLEFIQLISKYDSFIEDVNTLYNSYNESTIDNINSKYPSF